jgi:Immunity protein Imm1
VIALDWVCSVNAEDNLVTTTHDEIDMILDNLVALSREDWPAAAEVTEAGVDDLTAAELYVGFHVDRGALLYSGPDNLDGSFSQGDGPTNGKPILYMVGHSDNEFPPDSEIPIDVVRRAVHEFAETGLRPTDVAWQPIRGGRWI